MDLERMTQLLTVEEKLRGHPKLKSLHQEVMKELDGLVEVPAELTPPAPPPEQANVRSLKETDDE